jgi:hypothetical protein
MVSLPDDVQVQALALVSVLSCIGIDLFAIKGVRECDDWRGSQEQPQFSQEVRDEDAAEPHHAGDPNCGENGVQRSWERTVVARLDGSEVDEDAESDSENE